MELGALSISLAVKDIAASRAFYGKLGFGVFGGAALLLATLLSAIPLAAAQAPRPLLEQIGEADQALFGAIFDRCNPEALASMVTDDFEFYHDKWGQTARSKDEFVRSIRAMCERQRAGTDFRARRELTEGSMEVFPMKGYGAVQSGRHRFYRLDPGKPPVATERARFTHLWRFQNGNWRLARVFSYDHVDEPGSPKGP
jgi:catechol 2,3-dioxygenase-like lactoylglutathione lyase family enzyme